MTSVSGRAEPPTRDRAPWVLVPRHRPDARLRLICLHSAGGGPSQYRRWAASIPEDLELVLVRLPGREGSVDERPVTDYAQAIAGLVAELEPYTNRPYVLFGHSMGGLLAFGLTSVLSSAGARPPERLFVSGCAPPHLRRPPYALASASDEALIAELERVGGTTPQVLREPELLALILPTLRADYGICASAPTFLRPVDCPVTVFGGAEDEETCGTLSQWALWSRGPIQTEVFPGRHFYLTGPAEGEVIWSVLREIAGPRDMAAPAGLSGRLGERAPADCPGTLAELLTAQAARTPTAVAMVTGSGEVTYRELDARTNGMARRLIALGAGPETVVALALDRGADLLACLIAVIKAGAAYLPLDLGDPADRIRLILADARPVLLVSPRGQAFEPDNAIVSSVSVSVLDGDTPASPLHAKPVRDNERLRPLHPQHPAYVIYTSGSTGVPKGVVVCHESALNYLLWAARSYPSTGGTALVTSSPSVDLTVTGLFAPLLAGGRVNLGSAGDGTLSLLDGLRQAPCTFLKATPGYVPLLAVLPAEISPADELVLGGEQLYGSTVAGWRQAHPHATVVNEYGPTEATVGCMEYRVAPGQVLADGPVPLGSPIAGAQVYLLDDALRPVPDGSAGELYLAGQPLARGYLTQPARTAERFMPCPFGLAGQRMYRTGDLAQRREDRHLYFVGRADHQVKVRGYRVELGEVETAVAAHSQVSRAIVLAVPGPDGGSQLAAFVLAEGEGLNPESLRKHVAERLPQFMVPDVVRVLRDIPLAASGKADLAALRRLAARHGEASTSEPEIGQMTAEHEDLKRYSVVVNGEEQYSIWPAGTPAPAGWSAVGVSGSKDECLAHVEQVWTDMRPLSLRKAMDADREHAISESRDAGARPVE